MARVYLDSCMIIGLIEGDTKQRLLLKTHLLQHWICSSELARLETKLLAIRQNDLLGLQQFEKFFVACEMVALDRAVFEQATLLRAQYALKTPDALHLAAAIHADCQEFWTADQQLVKVATRFLTVVDWMTLDNLS